MFFRILIVVAIIYFKFIKFTNFMNLKVKGLMVKEAKIPKEFSKINNYSLNINQ